MTPPRRTPFLFLLSFATVLLSACGTTSPAVRAWEGAQRDDATACDAPNSDQCIVFACEGGECGAFACEDVDLEAMARAPLAHEAELARTVRPSWRPPGTSRNWRRSGLREDARPRMTFHFRYREGFLPAFPRLEGRLVKHHLFPQEEKLAEWFRSQGINVHDWTMVIPEHVHLRIHGSGGRGGLWNAAWREYMQANRTRRLSQEELLGKAFELAYRFDIVGPVVPYRYPVSPPGPQLLAP